MFYCVRVLKQRDEYCVSLYGLDIERRFRGRIKGRAGEFGPKVGPACHTLPFIVLVVAVAGTWQQTATCSYTSAAQRRSRCLG